MNFKIDESDQKLRGGYYTPEAIANFLTRWALVEGVNRVLEPSCGDGKFIEALTREISSGRAHCTSIDGVEILKEEADKALAEASRLVDLGIRVEVANKDFLYWINNESATLMWDAVIGNPPYIRYQYFDEHQQKQAKLIFDRSNVSFTKRTNAWVPFIIASVAHLNPGGRLAMVIPTEIMHTQYSQGLRLFLENEMEQIILVHIRDLVFSDAEQGIVLLMAQKRRVSVEDINGTTDSQSPHYNGTQIQIEDVDGIDDLAVINLPVPVNDGLCYDGNWMRALLSPGELSLIDKIAATSAIHTLGGIADVDIGIVTGANDFFVVDDKTLEKYDFGGIASPMLARGNFIKGITFTQADHDDNNARGLAVHFLRFPDKPTSELPDSMAEYLRLGVLKKLPDRYKCRIREPWYVVPYVWASELSLLKRCHLYPRIVINEAQAFSTDTAYRLRMREQFAHRVKDLTFSFLNSFSFLNAELLGRPYAGGALELVPSEIEQIPIPLIGVSDKAFARVDAMVRADCTMEMLLDVTDKAILQEGIGLSNDELCIIRSARERITRRRLRHK